MTLEKTLLLAAYTARSKAYVQALAHAGLRPRSTLLYGDPESDRPGQGGRSDGAPSESQGVFLPDLSVPLVRTLESEGWDVEHAREASVNDPELVERIARHAPEFVLFCGYGGEIVRPPALRAARFLHVHSGWLPDYRGSTTGYYSWLEEGRLGASAILLDEQIDTGAVLYRRRYPLPAAGIEMDYLWDPAIRADTLVRVLRHVSDQGTLPDAEEQATAEGRTFYVIHPVLKHLAILSTGT